MTQNLEMRYLRLSRRSIPVTLIAWVLMQAATTVSAGAYPGLGEDVRCAGIVATAMAVTEATTAECQREDDAGRKACRGAVTGAGVIAGSACVRVPTPG